jgi:hypothetical protein
MEFILMDSAREPGDRTEYLSGQKPSDHDVKLAWGGSCFGVSDLPTIMASVLAAFVSIRNFLTCTFTPLEVLLLAFLCELLGELFSPALDVDSLNRF